MDGRDRGSLAFLGDRLRNLDDADIIDGPSTRLLIYVGALIRKGVPAHGPATWRSCRPSATTRRPAGGPGGAQAVFAVSDAVLRASGERRGLHRPRARRPPEAVERATRFRAGAAGDDALLPGVGRARLRDRPVRRRRRSLAAPGHRDDRAAAGHAPCRPRSYTERAGTRSRVTHRALHHALGTFGLDLAAPEPLFARAADCPAESRRTPGGRPRCPGAGTVRPAVRPDRARRRGVRRAGGPARGRRRAAAVRRSRCGVRAVRHAALADRPELAVLPPRSAVAEALVRFSLGAESRDGAGGAARATGDGGRGGRPAGRPAGNGGVDRPRPRSASTTVLAGLPNVGPIRTARPIAFADSLAADPAWTSTIRGWCRPPRSCGWRATRSSTSGWCRCGTGTYPVRGTRASRRPGMPLQEAILRMTPDTDAVAATPTPTASPARSMEAERGGVDVTATDRPDAPPEPLPHDHGPDLDDHHRARARPPARDAAATSSSTPSGTARRPLSRRLVPGPAAAGPKPVRSDRRHRRALARHGHLLPGLVAQLERVRPAGRMSCCGCRTATTSTWTPASTRWSTFGSASSRATASSRACRSAGGTSPSRSAIDLSSSTAERLPPDPGDPKRGQPDPRPATGRGEPADRGAGTDRRRVRHLRLLRRRPRRRTPVGRQGPRRAPLPGDDAPTGRVDAGSHDTDGPGDPASHASDWLAARRRRR